MSPFDRACRYDFGLFGFNRNYVLSIFLPFIICRKSPSAYLQYNSAETVITMVYDDMLMAADGGSLYLLDLSAAFDTVDHDLLVLMHAETRTSVRSERCRAPVVQFIPLW